MTGFRVVGERPIHAGHVIALAEAEVEAPDGTRFHREVVHHPGAVAVVAVVDGAAVLVRQYRAPLDRLLLELPAGKRDVHGEPPDVTAMRELEEEVGLRAEAVEEIARFHNSPGFSDEMVIVYLARGLTPVEMRRDGIEEQTMTIEHVPLGEVPALLASGEVLDAKTIIGLLVARERLGA